MVKIKNVTMRGEIRVILGKYLDGTHKEFENAVDELCVLFNVVGRSEQLFCYHEGSYTLNEDGTCCKCHRYQKPKAK